MQVKSNRKFSNSLTIGKVYEVIENDDFQFIVMDDGNYQVGYSKDYFEVINEKQPNLIKEYLENILPPSDEFNYIENEFIIKFKQSIIKSFESGQKNQNITGEQFYNENYQ